jgi:hypothetical protein
MLSVTGGGEWWFFVLRQQLCEGLGACSAVGSLVSGCAVGSLGSGRAVGRIRSSSTNSCE